MIKTLIALLIAGTAGQASPAWAQAPPPQAYTIKAESTSADMTMTLTVQRDGARERVETAVGPYVMTTLYDLEAHRVYWIGWSGPGSCSSGRYLSARPPVDHDLVTGTADRLSKLTTGRTRKAAGTDTVNGMAARIETFAGGTKPSGPDTVWPTRVWLAEQGGYLLKLEAEGPTGKPATVFEVKQLSFATPQAATLQPPSPCTPTDSEMDDTGLIRAHAEATIEVEASGSTDLGSGKSGPR